MKYFTKYAAEVSVIKNSLWIIACIIPCSYHNVSIRCHDAYLKLKIFGVVFIWGQDIFKGYFWYENILVWIFLWRVIQNKWKIRSFRNKQHCLYWRKNSVYILFWSYVIKKYLPYLVFVSLFYYLIFITC